MEKNSGRSAVIEVSAAMFGSLVQRSTARSAAGRIPGGLLGGVLAAVAAGAMAGCGCCGKRLPAPEPQVSAGAPVAESPAEGTDGTFSSGLAGFSLICPTGWESVPSDSFVLMLVPPGAPAVTRFSDGASKLRWGERFISLDYPRLPPFRIPGFLPMGRVRSGYLDHLRAQAPEAKSEVLEAPPVPDAEASLVQTTWPGDRPTHVETALIMIHADHVYIVRGRSPLNKARATRRAFDQVVESLRWVDGSDGAARLTLTAASPGAR